jgi:hypothetical protein
MTYCRQGHTLVDNEAEAGWDRLPPATFFELVVSAVTYFGIVDEYTPPTPTTLVCRLYTDPARTILHTTPIATGVPYEINNGVDYLHDAKDIELAVDQGMGVWRSPPVIIRDDTGVWGGEWIASPRPDDTVEFNFDGTHTLFKSSVEAPLISEQAGAGLGAGTYEYCIVPVDGSGRLGGSSRTQIITLAGAADILIDWLPNTQVTNWNVYGRQSSGSFGLLTTLPGATVSYLDNGTDVPNPALLPPLFEDPAWTPAVINREQAGTDDDVDYIAEGLEDGTNKLDDGSSVSTFTADGIVDIQNTVESLGFDLTNLVSHSSEGTDKVLDPNLFTEDTGPVESLPPKVITYDYHVFIDTNGDTVITEADSATGQTTTITVDIDADTMRIVLSDSTGILADDTITIPPGFAIPEPTNLSAQVTLSNFRTQPDGTILGDERFEANTYDVAPQVNPGVMFLTTQNFGTPAFGEVAYSLDSAQSFANYPIPGTRLIPPPGFSTNRQLFLRAHGEGWTVIGLVNHPTVPSLVSDYSLHWTPDLTAVPWPFNDAAGRVASANITAQEFATINAFLAPTTSGGPMGTFSIRTFANGLGPVMSRDRDTDDQPRAFGNFDIDFFFPATNTWTFQSPGLDKYKHSAFWKEKNLLIGLKDGAISNIYTSPITTNEAAPLGVQSFQHAILPTPTQILAIGTTRDMAYVVWKKTSTSELGWSFSFDGSAWTDIVINNINDADYRNPGNEVIGLYPGDHSDPQRNGDLMWLRDTAQLAISTDNGATWGNTPAKPASTFNSWEWRPFVSGIFGEIAFLKTPMFWDGINFMMDSPNTFLFPGGSVYRMDSAFADDPPTPGGAYGIGGGDVTEDSILGGTTIGSAGSPNGIPAANLRRYLGRSVVIPLRVVNPPPPFNIRDTTKSAVYTSSRTESYAFAGGTMRATITEGPGGLGSTAITNIEEGQYILIEIPPTSEAYAAAKKPIPIDMKWTPFPRGTFE